jgi:RimJ/RimL family protein N-acetyltransferase
MPAPWPTPRLAFREMAPDDLDDMAGLLGDPQVMRYYPHPKSRQDASAWIAWNQRLYAITALACGCSRCVRMASSSATAA